MKTKDMKNKGNKKTLKRAGIVCALLLLFLALSAGILYYADARRLKDEFGRFITVNGKSLSGLTASEAAQKLDSEFQSRPVIINENGESVYELTLGEAGYSLDTGELSAALNEIIKSQEPGFHLFEESRDTQVKYPVLLSEETFSQAFTAEKIGGERTDSQNAYLTYDDEQERFVIIDEVPGNKISDEALQTLVRASMESRLSGDNLPESVAVELDDSVYRKPEITSESEELQNQMNTLNQEIETYLNTSVTHVFGDTKEIIDGSLICSWLVIDKENNTVQLSEDSVKEYISQLATKYNTIYRDRYFTTTSGETIKLANNEYGYRIDQDAEFEQLFADLSSGEAIEREPVYSKSGYRRNGTDDLMGTYIEVSLDAQHLWLYKDGALITETDIVSGKPGKDTETYRGAWPIAFKKSPYTLTSDIYGYEVPVTYWMPFVYGQGLHDLSSRTSFGGNIYKTNGSHGCVNLPLDQAKLIYETIEAGYPIILY